VSRGVSMGRLVAIIIISILVIGGCTPKVQTNTTSKPATTSSPQRAPAVAVAPPQPRIQSAPLNPTLVRPVSSLNLAAFPFDRRDDFREVLETRMQSLDQGIDELRGKVNSLPANGGEIMQQHLSDIATRFDSASDRLERLEAVPIESWNTYKRVLRDEIASLEQAYQQLQVAVR
jgi:hypothetical protein